MERGIDGGRDLDGGLALVDQAAEELLGFVQGRGDDLLDLRVVG